MENIKHFISYRITLPIVLTWIIGILTIVLSIVLFFWKKTDDTISLTYILFLIFIIAILIALIIFHTYLFIDKKNNANTLDAYSSIIKNQINVTIFIFNESGTIEFSNDFAKRIFEKNEKPLEGTSIFDLFLKHDLQSDKSINYELLMNHFKTKYPAFYEKEDWMWTNQGKKLYVSWIFRPLPEQTTGLKKYVAIGTDITELQTMLTRLTENVTKLRTIFNSVNDGIAIINLKGEILEVNAIILYRFGITTEQFKKYPDYKLLLIKLIPEIKQYITTVIEKGEITFESSFINVQQEFMTIEIRARLLEYEGEPAILAVGRNIIEKKRDQQKEFNSAIIAEEKERNRIAKELHDGVSPLLSTIKLYAQTFKDCSDFTLQNKIVCRIEDTINESIKTISEISNNLSPHVLENFGLLNAMVSFVEKVIKTDTVLVEIQNNIDKRFHPEIEITLYRVFTELFNNTLKHAEATKVFINLDIQPTYVKLLYTDNGSGFNVNQIIKNSKGMGLYNIINRVKSMNGDVTFTSKPQKGLNVSIKIPIE